MSEDSSIYDGPSFVVTTHNGTIFSCVPQETVGLSHVRTRYWSLMSQDGVLYTGPPYARTQSAEDVQRLVSEWWDARKWLKHDGPDALNSRRP